MAEVRDVLKDIEFIDRGRPDQVPDILENIRTNTAAGLPVMEIKNFHSGSLAVVGGGPSLADSLETIRNFDGEVWCINDSHDYLIERGIVPDSVAYMEVAPNFPRYIDHPHKDVRYLWASHCDPEGIRRLRSNGGYVELWNCICGKGEQKLVPKGSPMIPGGSRAALRVFHLGLAQGFRKFHVFGYDASYCEKSHAYYHRGAKDHLLMDVHCAGKEFLTIPGLARKAKEFTEIMQRMSLFIDVTVYGYGLIPHIARQLGIHADQKVTQ